MKRKICPVRDGWSRTMTHLRQSLDCFLGLVVILARLSILPGIDPIEHLSGAGT